MATNELLLLDDQQQHPYDHHDHHHRNHVWREEHFKLSQTNKRAIWYRMLKWYLFVHNFDPYAIFKGAQLPITDHLYGSRKREKLEQIHQQMASLVEHKPNLNLGQNHRLVYRDSLFRSRELQMNYTSRDYFRHRVTRILRLFSIYYLIKSVIISIAQHTLMRYEYLVHKKQSSPLISIECAQIIAQYLGNPYSALKDISLLLYAGPAGFCTMCIVLLPIYYRRYWAMNIAQLRFVLNPGRELKRVDMSSQFRLTAIKRSLEIYRQRQRHHYERARLLLLASTGGRARSQISNDTGNGWLEELNAREQRYCQMIANYLNKFDLDDNFHFGNLKSLRPPIFGPDHYVSLISQVEHALLGSQAGYSLCWLVLSSSLVYSAYSNKCPTLDCHPGQVFTWPESLVIVESLFILAVTNLSSTLNATLFSMLSSSQLELIKSISAELRVCNETILSFLNSHLNNKQQAEKFTLASENSTTILRDEIEKLLLKSLIRLMIYDRELRHNSQCISEQTLHPFYYVGGALLLAATGAQFKSSVSDWNFLRWFLVFVIWFSFNQVAVVCANIYARVLESERQLWSILALGSHFFKFNYYEHEIGNNLQLLSTPSSSSPSSHKLILNYSDLDGEQKIKKRFMYGKSCSFVADLWLKFVHSTSANVEQHCSRLFNIELNYRTIIEANFFSIFIYSLTLSPDDK